MRKVAVTPVSMFFPFVQRDGASFSVDAPPEERIVEGYCYVNAKVDSDNWELTRESLEAATEEYSRWGCVREMHQAWAAGNAKSITWDENGCLLRALISDDQAWKKVVDGTYKGFSVKAMPMTVRGKKVTACKWIETSLVDRPADPDAIFTVARSEDLPIAPGIQYEAVDETEENVTETSECQAEAAAISRFEAGTEETSTADGENLEPSPEEVQTPNEAREALGIERSEEVTETSEGESVERANNTAAITFPSFNERLNNSSYEQRVDALCSALDLMRDCLYDSLNLEDRENREKGVRENIGQFADRAVQILCAENINRAEFENTPSSEVRVIRYLEEKGLLVNRVEESTPVKPDGELLQRRKPS
jgi:hypothetical protein